jgi:alkylation response protein AidB-like acyl-CoA dehydrogenase
MSLRNVDDVCYPKQHSYIEEYRTTIDTTRPMVSAQALGLSQACLDAGLRYAKEGTVS